MTITSVTIGADRKAVVDFTLEDGAGNPVAPSDLDGDPRFILAVVEVDPASGHSRYRAYTTRTVNGANYVLGGVSTAPALASAVQPTADSGGTLATIDTGEYRYTFKTALPADYDRNARHTVGAYATRESRAFVSNPIFHLVPSGGAAPATREVVLAANCNECHDPLEAHGGSRREVGLCILCHTGQGLDPETGQSIEMSTMIHRIHYGEHLSKKPYYIVGNRQSVHDYSEVVFPQDARHCSKCHKDADDGLNWMDAPSRAACIGCHDDVDFETGENHFDGLALPDDTFCSTCHRGSITLPLNPEFDKSVPGAHVVPYESSKNPQLRLTIAGVQGMTAGGQPKVRFTIADKAGPVAIADLDRVAILFAGPTGDYTQLISVSHRFNIQGSGAKGTLTTNAVGDYTYAPDGYTIPAGSVGTWSVALEARTKAIQAGPQSIRFGANNPIANVDLQSGTLGGGAPVERRTIVDEAKCDRCHGDLRIHGNLRTEVAYCAMCHNPWATDEMQRPGLDPATNPPQSIDFRFMVHRIHRGSGLQNPFTVYGFGGTAHTYNGVHFPGNIEDCETCHKAGTQLLPVASTASPVVLNIKGTPVPQDDAIRGPAAAACTGCHDNRDAFVHTQLNSIIRNVDNWGEACGTCHGEGRDFAVSESHTAD